MLTATDAFKRALVESGGRFKARIVFLDSSWHDLEAIETDLLGGSYSVDKTQSPIRSCSVDLDNKTGRFNPLGEIVKFATRWRLEIGAGTSTGCDYIPAGVYAILDPTAVSNPGERRVTLPGADKSFLAGSFSTVTTVTAGTLVTTAIQSIAASWGETLFAFDPCSEVVPYDITWQVGDSKWDAVKTLADMISWLLRYNAVGQLRFKAQFDPLTVPACWKYEVAPGTLYIGSAKAVTFTELKNHCIAIGASSQTATVSAEAMDTNTATNTNVDLIGHRIYVHNNGSPDPLITTVALAQARADYELKQHLMVYEKSQIRLVPNYLHEEDDVIYLYDPGNGTEGNFELIRFSVPLTVGEEMTGEAWQIRKFA